ncbi:hypothetical protein D3Z50_06105 [Clostridiaceae bacterium]|nr:hypothetical protein [Clostridiaceae bacterium]
MTCFFCATPYHVLLASIMKITYLKKETAELILYNHFKGAYALYENLKRTTLFSNVYFINENNYTLFNKLKRAFHIVFPDSVVKRVAKRCVYNEIVFFAIDFLSASYIIREYNKRNLACIFSYGEDGIGTYMDPGIYSPSPKTAFMLKITGRLRWLDRIHNIYVLEPKLLQSNFNKQIQLICLPAFLDSEGYLNILWPERRKDKIGSVVYLQEPFVEDRNQKEVTDEKNVVEICQAIVGDSEFTIKLHPRTRNYRVNSKHIVKTSIPFECLLKPQELDDKIIISIMSTAAITPGLLYQRRPYIIFLYKLFPEIPFDSKIQKFLDCLTGLPLYSEKVFIPHDINEMIHVLKELRNRREMHE